MKVPQIKLKQPVRPVASVQPSGGGISITTPEQLEEALRAGSLSDAGIQVSRESAMRVAAFYRGVQIIAGKIATLPLHINRRDGDNARTNVSNDRLWNVLTRRPNGWQTPSQFRRMMQTHVLLRGNAFALIVRSGRRILDLIPLDPDRMAIEQDSKLKVSYVYTRQDGVRQRFQKSEILHIMGPSWDGIRGVSVLTYARESLGESLAMASHGSATFKNGARVSGVLTHPGQLGPEGRDFLKASLDDYRSEGEREGKTLILEEGMTFAQMAMTAVDAQWIESRKFSRTDIAMFLGIPPHMLGDVEKSTSWGSGVEQQSIGFVTYTLEDHLVSWEESIERDILGAEADLYAQFNRKALVRGDIKTRGEYYVKMLQWGVFSPNEVRALEDQNPREGGDIYYPPPNTAGGSGGKKDDDNEPEKTA